MAVHNSVSGLRELGWGFAGGLRTASKPAARALRLMAPAAGLDWRDFDAALAAAFRTGVEENQTLARRL
jgi:hypothetical protein